MSAFIFWFWHFQKFETNPFKLDDLNGVCLLQSLDYVSQKAKICVALTPSELALEHASGYKLFYTGFAFKTKFFKLLTADILAEVSL